MSNLKTPLLSRILWASGDILLRAELDLSIKTKSGIWEDVRFRVDPGSEITVMSSFDAMRLDIAIPQQAVAGAIHQPTGLEFRSGFIQFRVIGMDPTEYTVPCLFVGDPAVNLSQLQSIKNTGWNLLGLGGVVDKLRLIFDGDFAPTAIYGHLIVEKR